jgi:chemotaxis signal transduction protein
VKAAARSVEAILRERARILAVPEAEDDSADTEELAVFASGGHYLGVPMAQVTRAAALKHLTEIPGGPPFLVGVTAIEGHLVSLLDLPLFLGLSRRGIGDVTASLVVVSGAREIGLAAEDLFGIEDVPARSIAALPGAVGPLLRVARLPEREVLLLDVDLLFSDPRLGR